MFNLSCEERTCLPTESSLILTRVEVSLQIVGGSVRGWALALGNIWRELSFNGTVNIQAALTTRATEDDEPAD